jgi:hypothetical protein
VAVEVVAACEQAALVAVVSAEVECVQVALVAVAFVPLALTGAVRLQVIALRMPVSCVELTLAGLDDRASVCLADLATGPAGVGPAVAGAGVEAGAEITGAGVGVGAQPR